MHLQSKKHLYLKIATQFILVEFVGMDIKKIHNCVNPIHSLFHSKSKSTNTKETILCIETKNLIMKMFLKKNGYEKFVPNTKLCNSDKVYKY